MTAELPFTLETAQSPEPRLRRGRRLRGCNVHHRTAVFVQRLDPGGLSGLRVSEMGADFAARFIERFGGLESPAPGGCLPDVTRTALQGSPGLLVTDALLEAVLAVERSMAVALGRHDLPQACGVVHDNGFVDLVWEC